MNCLAYTRCNKSCCEILGQCVFRHDLVLNNDIPQALLSIHYAKTNGGVINALRKLKNNKPFKGTSEAARKHLQEIGLSL